MKIKVCVNYEIDPVRFDEFCNIFEKASNCAINKIECNNKTKRKIMILTNLNKEWKPVHKLFKSIRHKGYSGKQWTFYRDIIELFSDNIIDIRDRFTRNVMKNSVRIKGDMYEIFVDKV